MASARSSAGSNDVIEIEGVRVTHAGRELYPRTGVTKRKLIDYYLAVADRMLPHLAGRPLSLVRCPDGQAGECFFQKHAGAGFPDAFKVIRIKERSGSGTYLVIEDRAGLVAAAQMSVLELHIWASHRKTLEKPDRLVFDFDPDEGLDFRAVKDAAREMRERLKAHGLESFVMATGGKGLHVVVPIEPKAGWPAFRRFASATTRAMAADAPDRYLAKASKAERHGKIFIDYLRNGRGATAIAPFSSRAREGAPVAWPLSWDDLGRLEDARPANVLDGAASLARRNSDPWDGYFDLRQNLPKRS
jgi:bifunctional non-homologous end joining protein LigD